jgi:hypothetical protein
VPALTARTIFRGGGMAAKNHMGRFTLPGQLLTQAESGVAGKIGIEQHDIGPASRR